MGRQILEGIRVIDFGQGAAVPELGKILGEFGADVIEVESRHYVDFMRRINPPGKSPAQDVDFNPGFNESNRNKRSLAINLKDPRAQDIMRRLVATADLLIDNNSREVLRKWGFDYENVASIKPDIIYVQSTGFGGGGPYENYRSFTGAVASSGFHFLASYPDSERPVGLSINHPDHIAGKLMMVPVMAALDYRRRTGKGQFIDVSQLETASSLLGEIFLDLAINDRMAVPMGNRHPYAAPHGAYRCAGTVTFGDPDQPLTPPPAEDRWVAISALTEAHWQGLCAAMGNPAWTADPRFATLVERKRHEDELDRLLGEWTADRDPYAVQDLLQSHGVPAGVVETAEDHIFADPQMKHRGFILTQTHLAAGEGYWPGQPVKLSAAPALPSKPAEPLGYSTDAVCRDIGMSDAQIAEMRAEGVIGY